MDNYKLLVLLPQLIPTLANLIILGATVYALVRQSSAATGLMLFGAVARLISGLFFSLWMWFFDNDYERYASAAIPFQWLAYLGVVAFIVGFFMFAYKLFSTPAEV
jgi:hypothetical protein